VMVMVSVFRLIFSILRIPCTQGVCGPFFVCSWFYLFRLPPLMVPISYARPNRPTQHTNPLSVLSADCSHSLSVTPTLSCYLSIVLFICCRLHPPVVYCSNYPWTTICDSRVEKPILMTLPPYITSVWAGVVLPYPLPLYFVFRLSFRLAL